MNEEYLISGLKRKDKVVFDFVFNYYYSGLCAYARHWIDDADTAEDLVQDFFVKLWMNEQSFKITASLKSYFFASVKNKALDYLKHAKVKEEYKLKKLYAANQEENGNWELTEPELVEIIEKALQNLPPRCREIFTLSRFDGKNNDDIAGLLGISKRTVELQVSNALKILRTELKDYLPTVLLFLLVK